METPIVESTPAPITIPSMAEMRASLKAEPGEEPKTEAPEPKTEEVEAKTTEPDAGTGETQKEPEAVEEELPKGVQKKLAKEDAKRAEYERLIAIAVSARKAKEDELKKLSGSDPAPTTAKPSDGRPLRPIPDAFPTWGEYLTADAKYATEYETWLVAETRKAAHQEFSAAQQKAEDSRLWMQAVKDNPELPAMAKEVVAGSPEPLQVAISHLDNFASVTIHLGKNPEELAALVQKFATNPYGAVADLGKLEAKLQPATKQATPEKPLPAPLKAVGGGASASSPAIDLSSDKVSFKDFKKEAQRRLKAG